MATPLLVYVVGLPVQHATALSLIVVGHSALFGAWKESRHQQVHFLTATLFSSTGMIGAWLGAQGHHLVSESLVLFLFGVLLLLICLLTLCHPPHSSPAILQAGCAGHFSWPCAFKALSIGGGIGLLTGFFGVGGGFLIVPALMILLAFPIRLAIGTSFFIIASISLGGILGHLHLAQLQLPLTGVLIGGSLFGLWFGSHITRRISTDWLRKAIGAGIGVVGIGLILDNGWSIWLSP